MESSGFDPSALFSGFPEPVLLLRGESVTYCNPAAARLFPQLNRKDMLPGALYDLLSREEGDLLLSAQLGTRPYCLSRQDTPWGELVMLRPAPDHAVVPRPERIALRLRQQTAGLAAALQRLNGGSGELADEARARYLSIANQGLHRLLRLCDQLDFLEREDGELYAPAPLDLAGLCRELSQEVEGVAAAIGCIFQYESEFSSLLLTGDASLLRRLLLSLLSNALKALRPGGRLGLRLARKGERALLTVWDGGEGLDAEHLSALFAASPEPALPGGELGLGLETVRRIAQLHGGAVMVESRAGEGLRAVVSLPIRMEGSGPLKTPSSQYDASGGFSPLLVEFSDFLPPEFYAPDELD